MASESTEEETLTLTLPPDLGDWLDERARDTGLDRERILVQLVASYRASDRLFDGVDGPLGDGEELTLELATPTLEDDVERLVEERLAAHLNELETRLDDRFASELGDVESRVDDVQADVATDLQDVRERVVQVKRETDEKVPRDRHEESLERIDAIGSRLSTLEERTSTLAASLDAVEDGDEAIQELEEAVGELTHDLAEMESDLEQVRERLRTVGWIARDLRDHVETGGVEAVDRIKRAAARHDVSRARCEHCGEGVEIGLLTEPACPHCEATVTNVEAASGFFGSPRLSVAAQLESGEDR